MSGPAPSIVEFLESLELGHLAASFQAEDVDMSVLPLLEPADLTELGLTLGQRKKLASALSTLAAANSKSAVVPGYDPTIQLRRLSVMFCDMVGSTDLVERLNIDGMQDLLAHYYRIARNIAEAHDGHIATVQGDGVIMLFGFPKVLEGNAGRCVKAALAFQRSLADNPAEVPGQEPVFIRTRIGIATGKAAVGLADMSVPGGATRLVGPVVNRAARLQTLADELSILVDEQTRNQTQEHFAYSVPRMESLKGLQQDVAVSRALGHAQQQEDRSDDDQPLFGRDAELETLSALWGAVQAGKPAFATINGDAGVGKTALINKFLRLPENKGAQVIRLRCSPLADQNALWPVSEFLRSGARETGTSHRAKKSEELRSMLARSDPELGRSVVAYLGLSEPDNAKPDPMAGDRDAVLLLLTDWITRADGTPTVLWLENAHWADHTTLQLAERCAASVVTRPAPILMLASGRGSKEDIWADAGSAACIELEALSAEAAGALLDEVVEGHTLPISVRQRILRLSGGNPLMLETLGHTHGGWQDTDLANEVDVPFTIYESVSKRLDEIKSGRGVIQALAVLNDKADMQTIAFVMEKSGANLSKPLLALERAGLVKLSGTTKREQFQIRHQVYRDVIYEQITGAERRKLHSSAYRTLHEFTPGIESERPDILALHAKAAHDHAGTARHALEAGERLLSQSALIEAGYFFGTALAALEKQPNGDEGNRERLRAITGLASVERSRFGIATDESGRLGQKALLLARRLGDSKKELLALNGLYAHAVVRADYRLAEDFAVELRETARRSQDKTFEMIGIRARGAVSFHTGDLEAAEDRLQRALGLYEREQHLPLAHSLGYDHAEICSAFLAFVLWLRGDPVAARQMSDFSVRHSREIDHAHSLGQAMAFRVMLGALARDHDGLIAIGPEAVELGDKYDLRVMRTASFLYPFASQLCARQDPPSISDMDQLAERLGLFEKVNPYNYGPLTQSLVAEAALRAGLTDKAKVALQTASDVEQRTGESWTSPELDRLRAMCLDRQGKASEAANLREKAFSTAKNAGATMFRLRIACDMIEAQPDAKAWERLQSTLNRITSDDDAWDLRRARTLIQGHAEN